MNNESLRARGRLLNDVLSGEVENLEGRQRAVAIAAFRRARLQRRVKAYGVLIAIVVAAIAAIFYHVRIERPGIVAVNESQMQVVREQSRPLVKLTDEELIACFPSNSCFLAEVNGHQVLVFTERSLREKFLEKPASPASQDN